VTRTRTPVCDAVLAFDGTLWTEEEAAGYLRLSKERLRRMRGRREVPYLRLGKGTIRFDPKEIRAWILQQRVPTKPPPHQDRVHQLAAQLRKQRTTVRRRHE
jgi:excisionase family DNA binding protein